LDIRQIQKNLLILFIIISFFLIFTSISLNKSHIINYNQNEEQFNLEIAQPPLSYGAISRNTTKVYRLFESINITINTFDFSDVNYTKMQISFTNGSIREFDMHFIENNRFRGIYRPEYNAPLGMQNVSFLIYNETHQLLNSQTTYTNFTIDTNYMVNLYDRINGKISSEYYIEDILDAYLKVFNFSNYNFTWNTTIVDNLDESIQNNIKNFNRDILQFTLQLKNETFIPKKWYYVQLNMTDKNSGIKKNAYFPFYVRNNIPSFTSPINLSPEEVFRTEDFTVSFNVTDIETKVEDLIPWMYIYDPEGNKIFDNIIDFVSNNLFSETFQISANRPIGKYRILVTLIDTNGGSLEETTYLTVKNNAPEIHSYKINDLSMDQAISIFYGRDLVFSFNVSDIEGIAYVKVALINEHNEWFNITRNYIGINTEITIRTFDLIDGIWYVYIYVIDTDGMVVSLIDDYDKAPQAIRIIPDLVGYYLPWILLFGGLIFGLLLGVAVAYSYLKSKVETKRITPKKKKISIKKSVIKKKAKKEPSIEESEEQEIEEFKPEKEKEEVPQRKIKRKL